MEIVCSRYLAEGMLFAWLIYKHPYVPVFSGRDAVWWDGAEGLSYDTCLTFAFRRYHYDIVCIRFPAH